MQVCSMDESESESIIVEKYSTGGSELESIHKSINTNEGKYTIDGTKDEEPLVTDNPVVNEPIYFKLFKCGIKFLKHIDAICERACMTPSKDKCYMEMFNTLTDYNDFKNKSLSKLKIQEAIHKVIEEESIADSNNVTVDTFIHESNTHR